MNNKNKLMKIKRLNLIQFNKTHFLIFQKMRIIKA